MYHFLKYSSGNSYVMSDTTDDHGTPMLEVRIVVHIGDDHIAKHVGEKYYKPIDKFGNPHYDCTIISGDKDYILGLAALEAL